MELPDSIKGIGEQLAQGGDVAPPPEWFAAYDVFAAEVAHIFTRPWLAVDHASRLAADGDFLRADVGPRSIVVVRESAERIHALRNACLHAGYRVCEEDSGNAEHLFCQYHGWSYALDGRLTDPMLRPDMKDRSRFRLPHYAMQIRHGLIFVDPSAVAPEPPPAGPVELGAIPADLGERSVSRQHYRTECNWKRLRQFLWESPDLAFGGGGCDAVVEFGALSFVALRDGKAALVRLTPRFPGHTDCELVLMTKGEAGVAAGDPLGTALQQAGETLAAAPLTRGFYEWYCGMLPPAAD